MNLKSFFPSLFILILFVSCTGADNDKQGLDFNFDGDSKIHRVLSDSELDCTRDFSAQFWYKSDSDEPTVLLSKKDFPDKSIKSQENPGWALYTSGGTFAWAIGSGDRRLNYERDNRYKMPLNDGEWHLISMTYDQELSEFRLYYDGHNKAVYKVEFDFSSDQLLQAGFKPGSFNYQDRILPEIEAGAIKLQELVNSFNNLELGDVNDEELPDLIVDPSDLVSARGIKVNREDKDSRVLTGLAELSTIKREMLVNAYTVHQNMKLTLLKPVSKIYYLEDGIVKIDEESARLFTCKSMLHPSEFKMEELKAIQNKLTDDDILKAYKQRYKSKAYPHKKEVTSLNIGVWNIWHGGLHWNEKDHGWDSRKRIAEMITENDIDIILMQETYSNGDYIAAELGYYFATTSDWDYCYQGSNISVLSRYPIEEVFVPFEASFNNVGTKIRISKTQEIYAISNWYGMNSFPLVYDFHEVRFKESDDIPVFFGGDFNAVPHTDGGSSPASSKMLENGFTDAFRSLYPDVEEHPGFTHQSGSRIDQLYFKGKAVKNISTEVISDWDGGFPSDHFLILAKFEIQ